MKKQVFKMLRLITVLMLVMIMPIESFAAAVSDSIQLTGENGVQAQAASEDGDTSASRRRVTVTLSSTYAATDGVTSLQFSLNIKQGSDPKFVFEKSLKEKASITEYRYDSKTGQMNLYISGTKQLFHENDPLKIGYVSLESAAATVSVVENSLKYVYGTELRNAHDTIGGSDHIGSVEHAHIFDKPGENDWTWIDAENDGESPACTVKATCTDCGDTFTFDCIVSEDTKQSVAPTCVKEGATVYIATVELNTAHTGKTTYTNPKTKKVTIPATGQHNYSYTDNKDGETHTKTCTVCGDTSTEDHTFDTNHSCTLCQGEHTHSYGENPIPEFRWGGTDEAPVCEAALICVECKRAATLPCSLEGPKEVEPTCTEPGKKIYTAVFYGHDNKRYSSSDYDSDKVVLTGEPAKGHSYDEKADYQWSEDYTSCTAVLTLYCMPGKAFRGNACCKEFHCTYLCGRRKDRLYSGADLSR